MSVARTIGGAVLAAVVVVGAAAVAIGVSGFFLVFSANRGLLQLLVAVPLATLLSCGFLARARAIRLAELLWGMALIEAIVLLGTGLVGPGYRAFPWAIAMSMTLVIPGIVGFLAGSALARRHPRVGDDR